MQNFGCSKPSFETYQKALEELKFHQGYEKSDKLKSKFKQRRLYNLRFLGFELFGFSEKEKCKAYRLSIMDGLRDCRLEEHKFECSECRDWQYNFDNGMLQTENGELWQKPIEELIKLVPCTSEACTKFRVAYVQKDEDLFYIHQAHMSCLSCRKWIEEFKISQGEIKRPTTFEEYEDSIGLMSCCLQCGRNLVTLPNGKKQFCPNCGDISEG